MTASCAGSRGQRRFGQRHQRAQERVPVAMLVRSIWLPSLTVMWANCDSQLRVESSAHELRADWQKRLTSGRRR